MLQLPNGCHCSTPSIYPSNWNRVGASCKKKWYIQYYFYDPRFKTEKKNGKLVIYKGSINDYKTVAERKLAVKKIYDELVHLLQVEGYNPVAGTRYVIETIEQEIQPTTKFIDALKKAHEKLKLEKTSSNDVRFVIKQTEQAALSLGYYYMYISEIRRKHIKSILAFMQKSDSKFSAHKHNKIRSYLMILFKELLEMEAVDTNPVREISKMKIAQKLRVLLNEKERELVDTHLKINYPSFWRFLHIFFHSGARVCELLNVKAKDVNLERQVVKLTIKKGRCTKEVERTIKNIILPLWTELVRNKNPEDYIFSKGLVPGPVTIDRNMITRRWRMHVKDKLNIKADFYSLKHLNLDETAALLDINAAAALAGHSSTVITMKHYALNEGERQHQRLKTVANGFV